MVGSSLVGTGLSSAALVEVGIAVKICATRVAISSSEGVGAAGLINPQPEAKMDNKSRGMIKKNLSLRMRLLLNSEGKNSIQYV
jgi:hypothetical protein